MLRKSCYTQISYFVIEHYEALDIDKNGNKDRLGCFRNVWISFIRVLSDDNQLGYEVWKKEFVNCLDILLVEQSQGWRKIQVRILIQ